MYQTLKPRSGALVRPLHSTLWPKWAALSHRAHRGSILAGLEPVVLKMKKMINETVTSYPLTIPPPKGGAWSSGSGLSPDPSPRPIHGPPGRTSALPAHTGRAAAAASPWRDALDPLVEVEGLN